MFIFSFFSIVFSVLTLLIGPSKSLSVDPTLVWNLNNSIAGNLSVQGDVSCIPRSYGVDPRVESCFNAWAKIPRTLSRDTYGTRGQHADVRVPIRYQSDDGFCVIDLRSRIRDETIRDDVTRSIDVSDAAKRVMDKCMVQSKRKSGGSTTGFSMRQLTLLTMQALLNLDQTLPRHPM